MPKAIDLLISVKHRHAHSLRNGHKTVELRRRAAHLAPGTRVWIYTKLPRGTVELIGTVDSVVKDSPKNLWRRLWDETGITRDEFYAYFNETHTGCAILFSEIRQLSPSVQLNKLRRVSACFHPPQFLKFLHEDSPELKILRASKKLLREDVLLPKPEIPRCNEATFICTVAPGSYVVFAFDTIHGDYSDPEFLPKYAERAVHVTLSADETKIVNVDVIQTEDTHSTSSK